MSWLGSSEWRRRGGAGIGNTGRSQKPLSFGACGFESHPPHRPGGMYSRIEVDRAVALVDAGHNLSQVSRLTGASGAAIRAWCRGELPGNVGKRARPCFRCASKSPVFPEITAFAYAHLLG